MIEAFSIKNIKEIYIQTDNGSEFMGEFKEAIEELGLIQLNTHIRNPQENGMVERFNRSLKQECLCYIEPDTVKELNKDLLDYMIQYNFERIHGNIGNITPFERYLELKFDCPIKIWHSKYPHILQMLWTCTRC